MRLLVKPNMVFQAFLTFVFVLTSLSLDLNAADCGTAANGFDGCAGAAAATPDPASVAASGDVANQAAKSASGNSTGNALNQAGSSAAGIAGAVFLSQQAYYKAAAAFGISFLLAMQAGKNADNQGQALALQNKVGGNYGSGLTGDTPGGTTGSGLNGLTPQQKALIDSKVNAANAQMSKIQGMAGAAGMTVNPNGSVTTPDGKTIDPSKLNPDDLAAQGLSPDDIAAVMGAKAKVTADVKAAMAGAGGGVDGISFGGGGGGGGGGKSADKAGFDFGSLFGKKAAAPKARAAASIKGLSKKFGNDNIGVEGDNIFEMLNRRYDSEKTAGGFFPN